MRHRYFAVLFCAVSSLTQAQPSDGSAGTGFDGAWMVTMSCPNNTEKSAARGYKRQFPALVKDGLLSGEIGATDSPGWLRIDGRIGIDGSAVLDAHGRTGDPDYAVGHPPPSFAYAFHLEAHFDGRHGTGKRLEQRVCSFVFDRQ